MIILFLLITFNEYTRLESITPWINQFEKKEHDKFRLFVSRILQKTMAKVHRSTGYDDRTNDLTQFRIYRKRTFFQVRK